MLPRIYSLNHQSDLSELLRSFAGEQVSEETAPAPTTKAPLDIFEHADHFEVWLDLPGMRREDIKLSLEGETLRIQGERPALAVTEESSRHYRRTERWTGSFSRTLTLPVTVDGTRVEAKLQDGVLKLTLPKSDQAKPRQIQITG